MSGDPYELVLSDLEAKKAEIESAIRAIHAIRGTKPAEAKGALMGVPTSEAIKRTLKHGPMHINAIYEALKRGGIEVAETSAQQLAARLAAKGELVRGNKRGVYALATPPGDTAPNSTSLEAEA